MAVQFGERQLKENQYGFFYIRASTCDRNSKGLYVLLKTETHVEHRIHPEEGCAIYYKLLQHVTLK